MYRKVTDKVKLPKFGRLFSYFNKLKATLKQAYKEGYLQIDLNVRVERIPEAETLTEVLTKEELSSLAKTECKNPLMKRAALFSALTGLRFSDIQRLKWGNYEFIKGKEILSIFNKRKREELR